MKNETQSSMERYLRLEVYDHDNTSDVDNIGFVMNMIWINFIYRWYEHKYQWYDRKFSSKLVYKDCWMTRKWNKTAKR